MLRLMTLTAALVAGLQVFGTSVSAAPINAPVPSNAYTTYMGLDWAWANPCAPGQPSCGVMDLSYQSTQGWRLPTAAEVAAYISSDITAFVNSFFFAGANATYGGSSYACASAWFSVNYTHCDPSDAYAGYIWNIDGGSHSETFVIRDGGNPSPVPVPAAGFLLIAALGGLAALRRRASA